MSAVEDELRAELALVSEQHAAACAKYDDLRWRIEGLIAAADATGSRSVHVVTLDAALGGSE